MVRRGRERGRRCGDPSSTKGRVDEWRRMRQRGCLGRAASRRSILAWRCVDGATRTASLIPPRSSVHGRAFEKKVDMVIVILPDGSRREYDRPCSAYDVAAGISGGLARAAIVAEVDGELRDLHAPLVAEREDRGASREPRGEAREVRCG